MKINVHRYYIFADSTNIKIKYYKSLEELLNSSKDYIEDIEKEEENNYIGIGAEFLDEQGRVGAIDHICRRAEQNKFIWSSDIEKLNIEVPTDFREVLEKLIEMLEELNPEVDYTTEEHLIDNHLLDSLAILSLIGDIEDEFDVAVPTTQIIPSNFNSAQAIWNLIQKLEEN